MAFYLWASPVPVTQIGSVGISCVALNPTSYDSMKAIAPYQWLYVLYVLIGAALGVLGIRSTIEPQVLCEIWRAHTNSTNGAMYGWANTVDLSLNRRLPHKTKVKNLYLSGQWTQPGTGVTSSIISGWLLSNKLRNKI